MRVWIVLSVIWAIFLGIAKAQSSNPGWFVLDNRNSLTNGDANLATKQEFIARDDNSTTKQVDSESIFFDEGFGDKIRFAKNNKDLELASLWLKQEFKNQRAQNMVLSPLNFYLSSVLLANGVVDQTLVEFSKMFSVMRLAEVNQQIKSYILRHSGSSSIQVSLWGKVFSEHFNELMRKQLNAEIWGLKGTTAIINDWVKAKTNGKISQIISVEKVGEKDIFLVGSACFDAFWRIPFDPSAVEKKDFYNLNGHAVKTDVLHAKQVADFFENEEMYALRLFYETGDYISLFLPKDTNNFESFVEELSVVQLKPVFEKKEVEIFLPKIEIEYQSDIIKEIYKIFGVQKIFEKGNYEFAKMISFDVAASIENVLLKAKMKIDEGRSVENRGDIAKGISNNLENVVFNANRPFIFMINNGDFIGAVIKAD